VEWSGFLSEGYELKDSAAAEAAFGAAYQAVYGGLEVAIGLMIWAELTATVILIGAAYNAECAGSS